MYAKASHFKTDCERDLALKAQAKLRCVQLVGDVDDNCGHVVVCSCVCAAYREHADADVV